ncbi:maleate cis-trans isomerase family protein [Roseiterribacter gracilis]|uniref:Asp/Glu racemase n=1 Tax=Roseiterribacter gracilis TaxID=2812848 RepID=A0A8S8XBI0_9PROT|nr:Asp/Glu racemase [Rhodospirillales bacterium TMPK1]
MNPGRLIGILTPSGNPTVEPEMVRMFGDEAVMVTARLCSDAPTMLDRLLDYSNHVDEAIATFGGLPLDAIGFAVTGTSYLLGAEAESNLRVLTAPIATRQAFEALGVSRIALVNPYPAALVPPALAYWNAVGIEIAEIVDVQRTEGARHPIFDLTDAAVAAALQRASDGPGEAVLLTGSGIPSMRAMAMVESSKPVLSSNLCLAWALLRQVGKAHELRSWAAQARNWARMQP